MTRTGVVVALGILCVLLLAYSSRLVPCLTYPSALSSSLATPTHLTNEEYLKLNILPDAFAIDDTDLLLSTQAAVPSIPYDFGYSVERGLKLFPPYDYPPCEFSRKYSGEYLDLDYTSNKVLMHCRGSTQGKYVIGPAHDYRFTTVKEAKKHLKPTKMSDDAPYIEPYHEWVIGTCQDKEHHYELHVMRPHLLPEAQAEALNTTETLQEEFNVTKPPLTIAMLTVDSFSRRHFFRKLPQTVALLNQLETEGEWKVHDFKLHNIIGANTAENQSFIFGERYRGTAGKNDTDTDLFGQEAIWRHFKDKGFMTLLGYEGCAYKLSRVIGRMPRADHVVNPFYCAAENYSGYSSAKRLQVTQRCLGSHMAHWYMMNYTLNFMDIYPDNNHWAYNHFTAAHEFTGQHAQTLDADLVWYLKQLITRAGDRDLVVYVIGDHGMRYGNYVSDTQGIQEHRLPVFFLLNKRNFLNKIEYAYDALAHNTKRLTSKPDVRRSLMFLASHRYDLPLEKHAKYIDIFTEKASDTRTCEDIEIPVWFCSTNVMEAIPSSVYSRATPTWELGTNSKITRQLIETAAEAAVAAINSEVRGFDLCKELTLDVISLALSQDVFSKDIVMKLVFTVQQDDAARFEAWFFIKSESSPESCANCFTVNYDSLKYWGRLIKAYRTDSYKGKCEVLAQKVDLNAEYCICNEEYLD
jgi:hypothetical protein